MINKNVQLLADKASDFITSTGADLTLEDYQEYLESIASSVEAYLDGVQDDLDNLEDDEDDD